MVKEYSPSPEAIIVKLVTGNPKTFGSKARARFDLYRSGMKVHEFITAGGTNGDIYYDLARSYIAVTDYPYGDATKAILDHYSEGHG